MELKQAIVNYTEASAEITTTYAYTSVSSVRNLRNTLILRNQSGNHDSLVLLPSTLVSWPDAVGPAANSDCIALIAAPGCESGCDI